MTAQLLGKDDSSFDDSEVSTGRWQAYIDSFVAVCSLYSELWFVVADRFPIFPE